MTKIFRSLLCWSIAFGVGCSIEVNQTPGDAATAGQTTDATTFLDVSQDSNPPNDASIELDADGLGSSDAAPNNDVSLEMDSQTPIDATIAVDVISAADMLQVADAASMADAEPVMETMEQMVVRVLAAHGVSDMRTRFPEAEVNTQAEMFGDQVNFEAALTGAINSFLTDGRDVESPLSLVADLIEGPCLDPNHTERVRCFLNRETARLELYGEEGFAPEEGESIEANWILVLMAESLSDHIQWAIIDRTGAQPPYNYGFN